MTDTVEQDEDYTYQNGVEPTPLQARFADWLMSDAVGYSPATAKSKEEAFREGVRYAVALRIPYQASAHNKEATERERIERQEAKALAAKEREEKRAAKAAAKAASAEEPTEQPAPAATKPAKRTAGGKKATPAPVAPATAPAATRPAPRRAPRRAGTAAAPAASAEAPF